MSKLLETYEQWEFYSEKPHKHISYIFKIRGTPFTDEHKLQVINAAKLLHVKQKDIKHRFVRKYLKPIIERR